MSADTALEPVKDSTWRGGRMRLCQPDANPTPLYDVALAFSLSARKILEEVQSPHCDGVQSWIDDLREEVGEEQFAA